MIVLPHAQGTPEWRQARIGLPTASGLDNLLTPALKPSSSAQKYLHRLVAEWLLGAPLDDGDNQWMERGREMEIEGVRYYEMVTGLEVQRVGLCLRDDRQFGCSPDGLIGEDGGLEIKCPSAAVHVGYMLDPGSLVSAYRAQVQGALLVTGRGCWEIMSYNPQLEPVRVTVAPDAEYLAAILPALTGFLAQLAAAKEKLAEFKVEPDR